MEKILRLPQGCSKVFLTSFGPPATLAAFSYVMVYSCHMKDLLRWLVYGSVFAVPFVLLYVSSFMFFPYITGKNFAFRMLVEVAFASWFLLAMIDKAWRP